VQRLLMKRSAIAKVEKHCSRLLLPFPVTAEVIRGCKNRRQLEGRHSTLAEIPLAFHGVFEHSTQCVTFALVTTP
jgi:hypothetical protein